MNKEYFNIKVKTFIEKKDKDQALENIINECNELSELEIINTNLLSELTTLKEQYEICKLSNSETTEAQRLQASLIHTILKPLLIKSIILNILLISKELSKYISSEYFIKFLDSTLSFFNINTEKNIRGLFILSLLLSYFFYKLKSYYSMISNRASSESLKNLLNNQISIAEKLKENNINIFQKKEFIKKCNSILGIEETKFIIEMCSIFVEHGENIKFLEAVIHTPMYKTMKKEKCLYEFYALVSSFLTSAEDQSLKSDLQKYLGIREHVYTQYKKAEKLEQVEELYGDYTREIIETSKKKIITFFNSNTENKKKLETQNIIYYGCPGTGKTKIILTRLTQKNNF